MTRTPSAVKRGRNPAFPYVPVIVCEAYATPDRLIPRSTFNPNTHCAYATREEAVAHAQAWLDAAAAHQATQDAARIARHARSAS